MGDVQIVLPHGGYRKLIVYRKSDVIYEGTVAFCRRFLPKFGDRTVDQMTQAARSCKQNIADWQQFFETRSAETICNLMIVVIQQTKYLLDQMIKRQEQDFKKFGGVRERMHAARTATRGETWSQAVYSRLNGAATAEELRARLTEIRREADQAAKSIARRKGWAK